MKKQLKQRYALLVVKKYETLVFNINQQGGFNRPPAHDRNYYEQ